MSAPPAGELGILPTRSTRSCTECARRKTKCDHQIPCTACIKRGQASLCSSPPKRKASSPSSSSAAAVAAQNLDHRRTAALSELALFKNTLDTLRSRLPGLEWFVANYSGGDGAGDGANEQMDEVVRRFGVNGGVPAGGTSSAGGADAGPSGTRQVKEEEWDDESDGRARKRVRIDVMNSRETTAGENGDSAAAVDAAVDLEYATLGRSRTSFPVSNDRIASPSESPQDQMSGGPLASILMSPALPQSPISTYPDGASLSRVAPTMEQEDIILRVAIDLGGWHHRVFHAPTLYSQISAFWDLGEPKFVVASPAWLALYFALLAVGSKLLGVEEIRSIGWTEEETGEMANRWFECCVANLYRQNFLEHHDVHALQAIAVLALSGRDAGSPSLIANLLSAGLSIAQDMGLHKMPSEATFKASLAPIGSIAVKSKMLINREIKKRVFWALVLTDWFSIPFRSSWILGKVQIGTELPLNISDEDMLLGEPISKDSNTFTVASWLLEYVEIGRNMCEALEGSQHYKSDAAYQNFLKIDTRLSKMVDNPPSWLKKPQAAQGGKSFEYMRATFLIALHHKVLCIHRPYLYRPYKGSIVEFSRKRVISSARAILREAPFVEDNRIWTVLYHISAAAFIIMAELFDRKSLDLEDMRREVLQALPVMERLKKSSLIANRGLALVRPLLVEEDRLRAEEVAEKARSTAQIPIAPSLQTQTRTQQHQQQQQQQQQQQPQQQQLIQSQPTPPLPPQSQPSYSIPYPVPSPSPSLSAYTPTTYDFLNPETPGTIIANNASFPNWFYDLGIENGEQWLHSQLSGMVGFDAGSGGGVNGGVGDSGGGWQGL